MYNDLKGVTHGEDPLQGKRHSPSPLILVFADCSIGGAGDNDTTDRPAHLKSSSAGTSKGERNNLAGVGRGVRNEESPRDTFKRLSDHKDGERVGLSGCGQATSSKQRPWRKATYEEGDENCRVHQNQNGV